MKYFNQVFFIFIFSSSIFAQSAGLGLTLNSSMGPGLNPSARYGLNLEHAGGFGTSVDCEDAGVNSLTIAPLLQGDICLIDQTPYKFLAVNDFSSYMSNTTGAFQNQNSICECVNAKKNTIASEGDVFSSQKKSILESEEYAMAHVLEAISNFNKRSEYTQNMMILHAQAMGKNESSKLGLDKSVEIGERYKEFVTDTIKDAVRKNESIHFKSDAKIDETVNQILNSSFKATPPILDVLKDGKIEGEGCIAMKDFLLENSFPKDNLFWKDMNSSSASDWDIGVLKSQFLEAKHYEEMSKISSKIEFLEKNPLIKAVLNSGNTAAMNKVLNVMKKHMGNMKNCGSDYSDCHQHFKTERMGDYNKELAVVLREPSIFNLIKEQRKSETSSLISDLINNSNQNISITTLNSWANGKYGEDLDYCSTFLKDRPFLRAISINPENQWIADHEEEVKRNCLRFIPNYCNDVGDVLKVGLASEQVFGPKERLTYLYDSIARDTSPDPVGNDRYKEEVEKVCEKNHRYYNGQSINYPTYKNNVCGKSKKSNNCNNENALLTEFYGYPEDAVKNEAEYASVGPNYINYLSSRPTVENFTPQEEGLFTKGSGAFFSLFSSGDKAPESAEGINNESFALAEKSSFSLGKMANDLLGSADSGATSFTHNAYNSHFTETFENLKDAKEEVDKEIVSTKEAISHNKERLARPHTTPQFKSEVEDRVKMLERLLAEKEKSSDDYQKIINQLIESQQTTSQSRSIASENGSSEENAEEKVKKKSKTTRSAGVPASSRSNDYDDERIQNTEHFSTASGMNGGAGTIGRGSASLSSATGSRGVSSALLSKYGIRVQETDAAIQVAPDKERAQISSLLKNANQSDIGLEVSKGDYEKFKNYDISALNKLYEEKVEMLDSDVVKLMIHSEGESESLEFYAIKEEGRIVFQPVRKTRLTDLQNALNQ